MGITLRSDRDHYFKFGKSLLGAALVALVLLVNVLAVCPALHQLIHKDADQAGHECAVTLFARGTVESPTVEVPVVVSHVLIESIPPREFSVFTCFIENLPQGRAPPAPAPAS